MNLSTRHILILVMLLVSPFFFLSTSQEAGGRVINELWNLGHFVFFGVLTYTILTAGIWRKAVKKILYLAALILVIVILAGAIEVVQRFVPGRTADLKDFYYSLAGGLLVLLGILSFQANWFKKMVCFFGITGLLFSAFYTLGVIIYDEYCAYRSFPLLSGGESFAELSRWSGDEVNRVRNPAKEGKYALQVCLPPGKYPGISLQHFPSNWKNAKSLQFSVFNPGSPFVLHYRLHDSRHEQRAQLFDDRFNGRQEILQGWNTISVSMETVKHAPAKRLMDLADMKNFTLFLVKSSTEKLFYIDDVRLVLRE